MTRPVETFETVPPPTEGPAARGAVASSAAIALATAGIVLAPYATTTLTHRQALVVQATTILILAAAALVVGLARKGWRERLVAMPRGVRIGLVLYGGTALVSTLVALLRGNEPALIAGQLLSMGLLPLGAVAAAVNESSKRAAVFAWSLAGSTAVAAIAHFVHWGWMLREGQQVMRLFMGNSVSVGGVSLLALLLAMALAAGNHGLRRGISCAAAALIAVFIVGSGTRSLWLASAVGLAVALVLLRFWRVVLNRRARRFVLAAGSILLLVIAAVVAWWRWPRENLLPDADTLAPPFWRFERGTALTVMPRSEGEQLALSWEVGRRQGLFYASHVLWLPGGRLYRFSGAMRSDGSGTGRLGLVYVLGSQAPCEWLLERAAAERRWAHVELMLPIEHDVQVRVIAGTEKESEGLWSVSRLRIEDAGPLTAASLQRQVEYLGSRWRTTLAVFEDGTDNGDENVAFRLNETLAIWDHVTEASKSTLMLGRGLGARYRFSTWTWSDTGERVFLESPNYIHNFYAFLLYKTGLVGTVAVIAALLLWLAALRRAAHGTDASVARHLAAGGLAALAAYIVWSLACPEILDFRVAPLWGFVVIALTERPTAGTAA